MSEFSSDVECLLLATLFLPAWRELEQQGDPHVASLAKEAERAYARGDDSFMRPTMRFTDYLNKRFGGASPGDAFAYVESEWPVTGPIA